MNETYTLQCTNSNCALHKNCNKFKLSSTYTMLGQYDDLTKSCKLYEPIYDIMPFLCTEILLRDYDADVLQALEQMGIHGAIDIYANVKVYTLVTCIHGVMQYRAVLTDVTLNETTFDCGTNIDAFLSICASYTNVHSPHKLYMALKHYGSVNVQPCIMQGDVISMTNVVEGIICTPLTTEQTINFVKLKYKL